MDDQQGGFPLGNWQLDPYHTQVEFSARHLGMMRVRGHFAEVSATADIDPDHPEASSVEVTVQAASVRTDNETRDNDLRSSNFLEVDTHPTMTFKSTRAEPSGADRYRPTGDLTIKGITHPVTLGVRRYGELSDELMGHRIATPRRPRSTVRTSACPSTCGFLNDRETCSSPSLASSWGRATARHRRLTPASASPFFRTDLAADE